MSTTDTTCGNCEGIDPATCLVCGHRLGTERDERLREARAQAVRCRKQPRSQGVLHPDQERLVTLDEEVTRLDAVVTAVRGLHKRNPLWDNEAEKAAGYYNTDDMCVECWDDWPCDTVKILNGVHDASQ